MQTNTGIDINNRMTGTEHNIAVSLLKKKIIYMLIPVQMI